ncbi:glycosyltransferase family 2 protein [Paenibacillus caseinilyticus]|uniref:Glucosyl-3-phosphoglycerate synthase n=2 Tax=Paenibacillus mucilaginosus TaxID=61624 RepID=R9UL23_9BACL|nr:glycosyltransferase family A protein [Paenibacillus mucilaginosus]AGN70529.1 glycosyl transferase family 2 [Paenibacillus mucilaginosus K02]
MRKPGSRSPSARTAQAAQAARTVRAAWAARKARKARKARIKKAFPGMRVRRRPPGGIQGAEASLLQVSAVREGRGRRRRAGGAKRGPVRKPALRRAVPSKRGPAGRKRVQPRGAARFNPRTGRSEASWYRWGLQAGSQAAGGLDPAAAASPAQALQERWVPLMRRFGLARGSWKHYAAAARGFAEGFGRQSGLETGGILPLPTDRTAAAVLSVMNEEATIGGILKELQRLHLHELIVVVNGSDDGTFARVRAESGALVVHYPEALGYDVGRGIGAKLARADIVLFVDGDIPVTAEQLLPFLAAVDQGTDVALNDITPYLGPFKRWDGVSIVKRFLNHTLGRGDLQANSLTAVPHALSRRALETIGFRHLAVPPVAQAVGLLGGLNVKAPCSVDVVTKNRVNLRNTGGGNPVAELIIGDHMEALHQARQLRGSRLGYPDTRRRREVL